jgi:pyridoxal phosphate enzyme (YggS family)
LETLARNRQAVIERVAAALRAAGRPGDSVRVVAVTKSVEPEVAGELAALGQTDLGESRVAELERKAAWLALHGHAPRWHFVGHVQRNKARRVVRHAAEIHSVDSARLLDDLARIAAEEGRAPGIYLQVKLTEEPTKSGCQRPELQGLLDRARASSLPLLGLMTLAAPIATEADRRAARSVFGELAELAAGLPADAFQGARPRLSMGMSGDFEEAIAAGADVVRIGTAFFEDLPARPRNAEGAR